MSKIRKWVVAMCLIIALGYAAIVLFDRVLPAPKEKFKAAYALGELPPMMCFTSDSVFNIGSAKELDALPNIGKVLSQRIIDYRELWGDYRIPEDLTLVKGIGEKTMLKMLERLKLP